MDKFSTRGIDDADIAVIGMAGRFPGAEDIAQLWSNLSQGVEAIRQLTVEECRAAGVDEALLRDPAYVRAAAFPPDVERFDAAFFDIPPREAELLDPQHRLFLECAWEALEHAGYGRRDLSAAVGVFGGATLNTYLLLHLARNPQVLRSVEPVQLNIASAGDFLATRVAYKLNLRGASHTVQSACSTSLVAVHLACQSLLNEECDVALAGGVSVNLSLRWGYRYVEGGMASPDGRCRPFDASAQGTVFGSGVGLVVLKRLRAAVEDGDFVHAVIKGSAINNDGSLKAGYTAPSVEGQARVIAEALGAAGLGPADIGYVEAHGTATPLGDPIEVQALTQAFQAAAGRRRSCALGSLKGNLGHLDAAAGVTGLIKTVLALEHRQLPPSLHFGQPNPAIDFDGGPFYVSATLQPWPQGAGPRRAGVSSFGVGGTNAHVVLEEAPAPQPGTPGRAWRLLPLSARSRTALDAASARLAGWLKQNPTCDLDDVAWTLQVGRERFEHRRLLLCRDVPEALQRLEAAQQLPTAEQDRAERPVAFLFPGQGTQHVDMARDLYQSEPVLRDEVDRCCKLLERHLGLDLRALLYPPADGAAQAAQQLGQTAFTQPALFVIQYALARLWMSWGVRPEAMIGHSIGEYVAACLAGVFSLEDALRLVAARGRLMQGLPPGSMLAVPLPEEEVRAWLGPEISLAAINGPMQCVLSGPTPAIEKLQRQLTLGGVRCQPLATSHAFHSAMMDPILPEFTAQVAQARPRPPAIPVVSNVTGTWITVEQATRPEYWAQHLRQAVRFTDGLQALLAEPRRALLEVGPGQVLSRLARRHPAAGASRVVLPSLPSPQDAAQPAPLVHDALGRLWMAGVTPSWEGYHAGERRRRVPLPSYPFERQRYWVEPGAAPELAAGAPLQQQQEDLSRWFFVPSWRRVPLAPSAQPLAEGHAWLLFTDEHGLGAALAERLASLRQRVVRVRPAEAFARLDDATWGVRPDAPEDYVALVRALHEQGGLPGDVVHLWSLTAGAVPAGRAGFAQAQQRGLISLVLLARALAEREPPAPHRLWAVSDHLHDVTGDEVLAPEKATLLGACRVIPQEVPTLRCGSVDVAMPAPGQPLAPLVDRLLAELSSEAPEPTVALRGPHRWLQSFEPMPLADPGAERQPLREGGCYLVTHATGDVGFALASGLARQRRVRLLCLEPAGFPPREEWPRWLAGHPDTHPISRRIHQARALEALGAELLTVGVDLTDVERTRAAVEEGLARFGELHGALHAAWPDATHNVRTLSDTGPLEAALHLEPRALGLRVLDHVLGDRALDLRVVASSLASVLGGVGGTALAAASAFQDAFAQRPGGNGWLVVGWDAWRLGSNWQHPGARGAELDRQAHTAEQGGEALRRLLLAGRTGTVLVCTGSLEARLRQARQPRTPQASTSRPGAGLELHPRPELRTPFVPPATELERRLAALWQQALGVAPIGAQDNFFELGGDSLTAVQISDRIKRELGVTLPATSLYEGLTVQALARLIDPRSNPAEPAEEQQESAERLQRRKQNLERQRSRRRADDEEDEG